MCATEVQVCGFYIPQFFLGLLHEVLLLYVVHVEACDHKLNTRSAMSFTDDGMYHQSTRLLCTADFEKYQVFLVSKQCMPNLQNMMTLCIYDALALIFTVHHYPNSCEYEYGWSGG